MLPTAIAPTRILYMYPFTFVLSHMACMIFILSTSLKFDTCFFLGPQFADQQVCGAEPHSRFMERGTDQIISQRSGFRAWHLDITRPCVVLVVGGQRMQKYGLRATRVVALAARGIHLGLPQRNVLSQDS